MQIYLVIFFVMFSQLSVASSAVSELGLYIGVMIGKDFKDSDVSLRDIVAGIESVEKESDCKLDLSQCRARLAELQLKQLEEKANNNLKKSEEYLAQKSLDPDVEVAIPKSLLIKVVKQGRLNSKPYKKGLFHITATGPEGNVIRDSRHVGKPVIQDLDEAIKGFELGVKGMSIGERRILYIHPDLAYGDSDWYSSNSVLVIDLELVEILD